MQVAISEIRIDPTIHIRQKLDAETIERYMEILDQLPPIVLYKLDGDLILADGFHREAAAQRIGRSQIEAEVRKGTREEALEYAVRANVGHGRALTREEYREAVRRLKRLHPEWGYSSISKVINRSESFVSVVLRADEVRKGVMIMTPVEDTKLDIIRSAEPAHWEPLVERAKVWSTNELRDAIREIKDEAIPVERKRALLEGRAEPLTEKGGEPAVRRETLERVATEAKAEDVGMMLYGTLHHLANLKRFTAKEVVDRLEEHELQRLVIELPEYIEFQQSMLAIAKERLEIWEGG